MPFFMCFEFQKNSNVQENNTNSSHIYWLWSTRSGATNEGKPLAINTNTTNVGKQGIVNIKIVNGCVNVIKKKINH